MNNLAHIFGGIFGLGIAWLIYYCFELYEKELAKTEQEDLKNYKESLSKSN